MRPPAAWLKWLVGGFELDWGSYCLCYRDGLFALFEECGYFLDDLLELFGREYGG